MSVVGLPVPQLCELLGKRNEPTCQAFSSPDAFHQHSRSGLSSSFYHQRPERIHNTLRSTKESSVSSPDLQTAFEHISRSAS
ncbi:hypothetical protein AV530_006429 [Patagioenas fasciata monilis]|uniref:Uncharacterized protein n=1 Tax=Patagioenas fasciata monilis TaxID=372326 RepID=A0A1V4KI91_PATFA|nr:hypothetical protein AV530_006429 [Patagioenas fasciata monilis]